nr:discoidin domain-containing protein [Actinospica robiniae]
MWEQFYNMVRVGAQGIYISMFDEFGEGNQIVNTAPDQSTVPTNSGLYALNEDGTACSADYYMRLTGDGGRMLKGQIALTNVRPTQPVVGTTTPPPANANLALGKPTSASGSTQGYVPANTVDGNPNTYWESADNAFPQWLQVDLGSAVSIGSITLRCRRLRLGRRVRRRSRFSVARTTRRSPRSSGRRATPSIRPPVTR